MESYIINLFTDKNELIKDRNCIIWISYFDIWIYENQKYFMIILLIIFKSLIIHWSGFIWNLKIGISWISYLRIWIYENQKYFKIIILIIFQLFIEVGIYEILKFVE